jgi:hypothetical protein
LKGLSDMKMRNPISVFLAGAAIAIGLGVQAQSVVTLSGGINATCTYTSGTVGVGGNLTFVCAGAAATVPTCTFSPAPQTSLSPGGSTTLAVSCLPGPITAYNWTNPAGGPNASGASTVLTFNSANSYAYAVTASNAVGPSQSIGVTINVVAPTNPPVCTPTTAAANTGGAGTVSANCTNGPTTYNWTLTSGPPGAPPMTPNVASATIGPFPTAGTYIYSVTADNGVTPAPNATATSTVTVTDPVVGTCVAPAIPPKLYPAAGENIGSMYMALPKGFTSGAAVFTMPLNGTKDVMLARYNAVGAAETPNRSDVQLVVSKCPGDFTNIVNTTTGTPCSFMGGKTGDQLSCQLPAGNYYLNVRHVYPNASWTGPLIPLKDSCGTSGTPIYGTCAHVIAIQ